jgi:hypothetical protein
MCAKYDRIQDLLESELAETQLEIVMGGVVSVPQFEALPHLETGSISGRSTTRSLPTFKPDSKTS